MIQPTWEPDFAEGLRRRVKNANVASSSSSLSPKPYLVGLVGIPGSGKTTSGQILCDLLNHQTWNSGDDSSKDDEDYCCVILPMDGYHFSLEVLRSFPDANDAIYRRGAPDTFDVAALKRDLQKIKHGFSEESTAPMDTDTTTCTISSNKNTIIGIPGFDHAIGDPIPNVHVFDRNRHNIVIMEGLYLLHQRDNWVVVHEFFDEIIYLDLDLDTCLERLKKRNLCLQGYTPEEILVRVDIVDRENALLVQNTKYLADTIVIGGGV